jgi:hypothetical protein
MICSSDFAKHAPIAEPSVVERLLEKKGFRPGRTTAPELFTSPYAKSELSGADRAPRQLLERQETIHAGHPCIGDGPARALRIKRLQELVRRVETLYRVTEDTQHLVKSMLHCWHGVHAPQNLLGYEIGWRTPTADFQLAA